MSSGDSLGYPAEVVTEVMKVSDRGTKVRESLVSPWAVRKTWSLGSMREAEVDSRIELQGLGL